MAGLRLARVGGGAGRATKIVPKHSVPSETQCEPVCFGGDGVSRRWLGRANPRSPEQAGGVLLCVGVLAPGRGQGLVDAAQRLLDRALRAAPLLDDTLKRRRGAARPR